MGDALRGNYGELPSVQGKLSSGNSRFLTADQSVCVLSIVMDRHNVTPENRATAAQRPDSRQRDFHDALYGHVLHEAADRDSL
ncbi:hypothetical protein D3C74_424110 [compost metagenome]